MENKNIETTGLVDGKIEDCSVEVINDIQVIDYSKGKTLHVRFNYRSDPTEEFGEGGHLIFKFKYPRDALKCLTKNLEIFSPLESGILFEYIQHYENEGIYSPLEIYYILILEIKLPFIVDFVPTHQIPKKEFKDYTPIELENYLVNCSQFRNEYESTIREAHKFAVANTWKVWNDIQYIVRRNKVDTSEFVPTVEDIKRSSIPASTLFDTKYKGREVSIVFGFNLYRRLWKVVFEDNSWVIAGDRGNGWYSAETNFNSYKLLNK